MNTVQAELTDFLSSKSPTRDLQLRARNVDIVMYLYGFDGPPWPTLKEAAARFGLKDRQRIEQIKQAYFPDPAAADHLPSLHGVVGLMKESRYWLNSELKTTLVQEGLVDAGFGTTGLLRLAAATGLKVDYAGYTPDLKSATRLELEKCQDYFLMESRYHAKAKLLRNAARKFHRKYGLARIDDFLASQDLADDTEQRLLLEAMLRIFDKGWIAFHGDAAWYLFDDVKHTIRNASEKVLAAVQSCNAELLAEACGRSLAERNYLYPFASEDLIREYLTTSTLFDVANGRVQYARPLSKKLTDIDSDLVDFLKTKPRGSDGHEIRVTLRERGHRNDNIDQTLGYSPLLQRVVEPRGPGRYSAVPQTSAQCELSLCVPGIRRSAPGFEQVQERSSREQVELQEAQDLAHGPRHLVDELQVGEQEMHAHRDPDLRHDGIARSADEALDAQVLLDPPEEGLDLPTLLVDVRDGLRGELEVVGQERVELLRVGVAIADSTQRDRTPGAAFDAGQLDGLVRRHAQPRRERPPLSNRVLDLALQPSDQENPLCIKGFQPLEVEVQTVRSDDASPRQAKGPRHLKVRPLAVRDLQERRQTALVVKPHVQLQRSLRLAVLRPGKQLQAQVHVRRIEREQLVAEPETMPRRRLPASRQQTTEQRLVQLVGLPLVDARQRRPGHPAHAKVVELVSLRVQVRHDVAQAAPPRKAGPSPSLRTGSSGSSSAACVPCAAFPPPARTHVSTPA